MPAKAVVKLLIVSLLLLGGCKHIGLLFEPPSTLKAVVQGEIKGINIHCEKTLILGSARWEVMCKVSDNIDIKYRTQSINHNQTKLEILIDKQSGDYKKTIAAPMVIVNKGKPANMEMVSDKARIAIRTEPMR
jgi:hypothetical protein